MTEICDPFTSLFANALVHPAPAGTLGGLRVAVKDNFDIAGHITGAGNPEYAEDQTPALAHADAVVRLLEAGASIVGKTHMDELAYSLMGVNSRYGTPINPAAVDRVPGGSSSGSAAAVAAGRADIGLGSDTGGSVRLPASFCGLVGWRPSHGLFSPQGMLGLAPSYDVPGFFTRDLATLTRLANALCEPVTSGAPARWVAPTDLWALCSAPVQAALRPYLPQGCEQRVLFDPETRDSLLPTFRTHQGYEIWHLLGEWITRRRPAFGPGINERFQAASQLSEAAFNGARNQRTAIREGLQQVLADGTVLVYPTAPGPAPLRTAAQSGLEQYRNSALTLLSVAGHAGLVQITLPLGSLEGAPLGLSFVARAGSDLELIRRLASSYQT